MNKLTQNHLGDFDPVEGRTKADWQLRDGFVPIGSGKAVCHSSDGDLKRSTCSFEAIPIHCRCGRYPTVAELPSGDVTIECECCGILFSGDHSTTRLWNAYQAAFPN